MKILGVNTSHESSFCLLEDGQITKFAEEDRARRQKYWSMEERGYHSFVSLQTNMHLFEDLDYIIFSSFDRRNAFSADEKNGEYIIDPVKGGLTTWQEAEQFMNMWNAKQLSRDHYEHLCKVFPGTLKEINWEDTLYPYMDEELNRRVVNAHFPNIDEGKVIFHPPSHHVYHVLSGYHFSPWNGSEEAIGIAWDGGGAKTYHEQWPDYQEVETIWKLIPGANPVPQWKRMSNSRALASLAINGFPHLGHEEYPRTMCISQSKEIHTGIEDGVEVVFDSKTSNGMNFSELCVANGFDDLGRNSGKVMGWAAYGRRWNEDEEYDTGSINSYNLAEITHYMQRESFDDAVEIIQRAIDLNPDCKNIVLSGGFSLNCTNNYKYLKKFPEHKFFVDPAANDSGTSIGAALFCYNDYINSVRSK